ncbi:response regulator transcription factor [Taibaiella helva]|uniref:response regulator transcription factor n=1 Tax=Taibaiella helva TaxID=2301235 RepID=UPI000E5683D2|nr:response regulator transcription factor [Taibaiella helva]
MSETVLSSGPCPEVMIADHSPIVRYGIKSLLKQHFPGTKVREAESGRQVMGHYHENTGGGILVIDPNLPDADPQTLIQGILLRKPDLPILVLSISKEELFGPLYLKIGAKGFLNKRCPEQEIVQAVGMLVQGKRYIRMEMQELYLDCSRWSSPYERLTRREREVLKYLVQGESVTSISRRTNNSTNTVSTHKSNIFKKLRLGNLIELKLLVDSHPID